MQTNIEFAPLISLDVLKHYALLYAGGKNLASAEISPLFANLERLPPMLALVDKHELLLDDAIRLEKKILASGGVIKVILGKGLWHVWPTWCDFPEARIALLQIAQHIRQPAL